MPDEIKQSLRNEEITVGHARAILAVPDANQQIEIFNEINRSKLNVRDVETLVSAVSPKTKVKKGGRKRAYTRNAELNDLVEKLTTHLGTKVKIFGTPERGRIEINYYSREDLDRVLEMLLGQNQGNNNLAVEQQQVEVASEHIN